MTVNYFLWYKTPLPPVKDTLEKAVTSLSESTIMRCPHEWLQVEIMCLLMMTEITGWVLKCAGLYFLLSFSQMLQNSSDRVSQYNGNDTKHTAMTTQEFLNTKKLDILPWSSQWPDVMPAYLVFLCVSLYKIFLYRLYIFKLPNCH